VSKWQITKLYCTYQLQARTIFSLDDDVGSNPLKEVPVLLDRGLILSIEWHRQLSDLLEKHILVEQVDVVIQTRRVSPLVKAKERVLVRSSEYLIGRCSYGGFTDDGEEAERQVRIGAKSDAGIIAGGISYETASIASIVCCDADLFRNVIRYTILGAWFDQFV
jgi:hypothetical protein